MGFHRQMKACNTHLFLPVFYTYCMSWSLAVYKDTNFLKALVFLELNLGKLQDSSMVIEES